MKVRKRVSPWRGELSRDQLPDGSTRIRYGIPISLRARAKIVNIYRDLLNFLTNNLSRFMGGVLTIALFLMIKESSLPIPESLMDTMLEEYVNKSARYSDIIMAIATGLFAGYFVWFFDSYLPSYLTNKKSERLLVTIVLPMYRLTENLYHVLNKDRDNSLIRFYLNSDIIYPDGFDYAFHSSRGRYDEHLSIIKKLEVAVTELRQIDSYWDFDASVFISELHISIKNVIVDMESSEFSQDQQLGQIMGVFRRSCSILIEKQVSVALKHASYESVNEFSQYLSRMNVSSES